MKSKVLMVAAEASSALYAQRLLEYWEKEGIEVDAFGVGSQSMENLGFERLGKSEEMAVVGVQEVVAHWGVISRTFHKLVAAAKERKPDLILLLDYPDFNLRLAKKMKRMGLPVIYYISPQIWAWRQSRVHTIKKLTDKVLCLFPFEKPFYEKFGVNADFVGHPLLDELNQEYFEAKDIQFKRSKYGIREDEFLLGLMPGSRRSELKHHLLIQILAAEKLWKEKGAQIKVGLFVAPTLDLEEVRAMLPPLEMPLMLIQKEQPQEMITMADIILTASGTATLMVGLLEKPMVIMYKMNSFTAWVARTFVKSTPYFGMINLVCNRMVVPELFQEQASADNLCAELKKMMEDSNYRNQIVEDLKFAKQELGDGGATRRVAKSIEPFFKSSPQGV